MSKTGMLVTLAATALAALFIVSSTFEPAVAKNGPGGHSTGGGGGKSFSGGGKSFSGRRSYGSTRQFSRTFRSPSSGSSKVYGYRSNRGHHHRHFRGGSFVYGYPYVDGYYGYSSSCEWMHRRALATGSSYWWNRYNDCINDY